jgi:hypothetical protein
LVNQPILRTDQIFVVNAVLIRATRSELYPSAHEHECRLLVEVQAYRRHRMVLNFAIEAFTRS